MPKYENHTQSMAKILKDMLAIDSNRLQSREEIRSRWMLNYPEHAKSSGLKSNSTEKKSKGTIAKSYIQNAIKDLEARGVVQRVNQQFIRITDIPQLMRIARWKNGNEED